MQALSGKMQQRCVGFKASVAPRQGSARPCVQARAAKDDAKAGQSLLERVGLGLATAATIAATSLSLQFAPPAEARLTAGDPIKNASAILRYALPIDNKPIREIQKSLESISDALRVPGAKNLGPISRLVNAAKNTLNKQRNDIVNAFAADKKAQGLAAIESLEKALADFDVLIGTNDKQNVPIKQREALSYVGQIEEAMVKGFPFSVPPEYANRPLLLGRATLAMRVDLREGPEGPTTADLTIVLDGYNAPVSAGQFADLVKRGFYNGMEVQRSDGFVVQTGDPEGPDDSFRDPETGEIRNVPFEVRVVGDKEPVYDFSLEDLGRVNETVVLPFNAYGTLAWARNEFENNSASSQVFFLLKENELTPSGANLLDGRFAVFGYVTEGADLLGSFKVGDKIEFIKFVDGVENLKNA